MPGIEDLTLPTKRVTGETVEDRLTANAAERILPARYLRTDADGRVVETPSELFRRVAEAVAAVESEHGNIPDGWADEFESVMTRLEFLPNSPTLMNAGTDLGQLAACFVMSPRDDLDDIFDTVRRAARIFQTGGGVGYAFSNLRPYGDVVCGTGGVASGPVSFMRVFDTMCETIKQGGRRRGAQMAILRVDHPDVARFATAKREEGRLENFNVSVGLTDDFLAALDAGGTYPLRDPRTGARYEATEYTARFYNEQYADADRSAVTANLWRDHAPEVPDLDEFRGDLVDPGSPASLPAALVWRLLVDGAWRNGEPGVFHLDAANREHSFDVVRQPSHRIEATNPCGEQPLENYEACNLGHVNLSLMADERRPRWSAFAADRDGDLSTVVGEYLDRAVDWQRLDWVTRIGTRFLDDVVSASTFPLPEIESTVGDRRKVGLGVMGFAELLAQFGVRYGSDESVEIARQLMAHVDRVATQTSHELANSRGSFPLWDESKYADPGRYPEWFRAHTGQDPADWGDGFPIRNHGVTSVAPTGTTSMLANTSAGCEPFFEVVYFKNVGRDVQGAGPLVEFDDYFLAVLEANDVDVDAVKREAVDRLRAGTFEGIRSLPVPGALADLFVGARTVTPTQHVRVQAAFQSHVDGAVSKTINAPAAASREDVGAAFRRALDLGCLGVTVYRTSSRSGQVLATTPVETADAAGSSAGADE